MKDDVTEINPKPIVTFHFTKAEAEALVISLQVGLFKMDDGEEKEQSQRLYDNIKKQYIDNCVKS